MAGAFSGADSEVSASTSGVTSAFKLHTLSDGAILNSGQSAASTAGVGATADSTTNNMLVSGSKDNLRWEIANVNVSKGTFTLYIRSGNDTIKRKNILETWNNLSLDPNSTNYIAKRLGDSKNNLRGSGTITPYIQASGSYPNKIEEIVLQSLIQLDLHQQ